MSYNPTTKSINILFVDDEINVLEGFRRLLRDREPAWKTHFAENVDQALQWCGETDFDVILSDVSMPQKDGFHLLNSLKGDEKTRDIPVVILTGLEEKSLKRKALDCGAADLLNKPIDQDDLIARINNCLRLKSCLDGIKGFNSTLQQKVREQTRDLIDSRVEIVRCLGKAAEFKNNETGMHVIRMSHYSALIGKGLGLSVEECDLLLNASPMHDVGKIGIPDRILLKPGKLDDEEWEIMKTHTLMGKEILSGGGSPLLLMAETIALSHQEKWDGSGYPHGLKGEQIPLAARIVALADVFDAVTSARPYKKSWTVEDTVGLIQKEGGKHFDPGIVPVFMKILPDILEIKERFAEPQNITLSDFTHLQGGESAAPG